MTNSRIEIKVGVALVVVLAMCCLAALILTKDFIWAPAFIWYFAGSIYFLFKI